MTARTLPRGIRNNNPGNIRLSATRWRGQKEFQFDPEFVEFETPVLGLRALMRLLLTYHFRHGLDTVESIINRYAPPHENATDGYIHHVCRRLRVGRREKIAVAAPATLAAFARAICHHENGPPPRHLPRGWFPDAAFDEALRLALETA
jgi:hypothetical protein